MTFHTLAPQPGRVPYEVCVSVIAHADRVPTLRVSLHADMLRKLGWTERQQVEVQIGEGQDQGYLRLRPSHDIGFRMKRGGNTSRWLVQFKTPAGAPAEMRSTPVKFIINQVDRSMKLRLPWAANQVLRVA